MQMIKFSEILHKNANTKRLQNFLKNASILKKISHYKIMHYTTIFLQQRI